MRLTRVSVFAAAFTFGSTAWAQEPHPGCTVAGNGGNACQMAVDLFHYMNPQLGMLITGGNATLGQAGPLGGLGKFAFTLRANLTPELTVPQLASEDLSGPVEQRSYATRDQMGGFPVADAAIGIWGGIPLGLARVGGVDALVNVFYVPTSLIGSLDGDGYGIALPDGGMRLGYGARLGVLSESALLPGVSITYLQRNLPKMNFAGFTEDNLLATPDSVRVQGLEVRTSSWRLVAGKNLGPLAFAAGYGQDRYRTEASLDWVVHGTFNDDRGGLDVRQNVTRSNMFADVSFNLFLFRVVGELGQVTGGKITTYNEFDVAPGKARTYGAIGIRFGN